MKDTCDHPCDNYPECSCVGDIEAYYREAEREDLEFTRNRCECGGEFGECYCEPELNFTKVVFVGVHFKPGMKALDSNTYTGRIIDMIIARIGDIETEKTNIFPTDYMPMPAERWTYSDQFNIEDNALYVGLGLTPCEHLKDIAPNLLQIYHPGYPIRKGKAAIKNYINDTVEKIQNLLTAEVSA